MIKFRAVRGLSNFVKGGYHALFFLRLVLLGEFDVNIQILLVCPKIQMD
jgi:hypothetical protein